MWATHFILLYCQDRFKAVVISFIYKKTLTLLYSLKKKTNYSNFPVNIYGNFRTETANPNLLTFFVMTFVVGNRVCYVSL